jgi:hypothetical protein
MVVAGARPIELAIPPHPLNIKVDKECADNDPDY